jgi:hypothetical protein
MDNQILEDLEKIFKAGGDAICLPKTKAQTLTDFLNQNEDLALRLGGVVGRSEQLFCHTCKNEMPENEGGNCCSKCWNEKYGAK